MAVASAVDLKPVADVKARLQDLLGRAKTVKPESSVEPALPIAALLGDAGTIHADFLEQHDQTYRFAAMETAVREIFYSLVSSTSIVEPEFVEVWNLLDIVLLLGDQAKCTPELVCWLIEELLDSQTTEGCRTVFDYLESRRERLAQKDFHKKNLVFLRSCNELLRRLSRAEDAIFCGRVFFFLFQTFPLGDKSSVNLRGEFHTENTTKYEELDSPEDPSMETMNVDKEPVKSESETPKAETPQPSGRPSTRAAATKAGAKAAVEEVLPNNQLYPIFWGLQKDFANPTRLFNSANFESFQKALSHTILKFKKTPTVDQSQDADSGQRGKKRKLVEDGSSVSTGGGHDSSVDNYNTKYLTSPDLFDLELSDLTFQRHILLQALILIDFLLSLTQVSRDRLSSTAQSNKSVFYSHLLEEPALSWVVEMQSKINTYLRESDNTKGQFQRQVKTVLARDKNWVRWKVESCPSILRDPVSMDSEWQAREGAKGATKVHEVAEKPANSMSLDFLKDGISGGLEALKDPSRFRVQTIDELIDGIRGDELDLEMAVDDEETEGLENAIMNKRWRILRQASTTNLSVLDKIEPGGDLDPVFRPPPAPQTDTEPDAEPEGKADAGSHAASNSAHPRPNTASDAEGDGEPKPENGSAEEVPTTNGGADDASEQLSQPKPDEAAQASLGDE